jgi:hypothetical protein
MIPIPSNLLLVAAGLAIGYLFLGSKNAKRSNAKNSVYGAGNNGNRKPSARTVKHRRKSVKKPTEKPIEEKETENVVYSVDESISESGVGGAADSSSNQQNPATELNPET